jgi:hypothetical protein
VSYEFEFKQWGKGGREGGMKKCENKVLGLQIFKYISIRGEWLFMGKKKEEMEGKRSWNGKEDRRLVTKPKSILARDFAGIIK